ncbi:2-dehydropantoate 2-reductase [Aquihabitans sp. G128]|uniref:ketopantoate reductase family protein n=1 Tax=Aquihabitans sp. G128 TaxID=2849779 RepID=UPI001C21F431|nr:2-dehydropantoate 2-reductase [Aquihabitans sp. G128]QXC61166.1 2-dehydropantoate 2-reductase [Aquihabitans sp. G128]
MRFVVIGTGAIGGVVGGYLARSGQDVALVARGEHGARIRADGLTVRTPQGDFVVHPPTAATPAELGLSSDDVVLLAVKGQDTRGVLDQLAEAGAPSALPVACLQNGIANEAVVAERFAHTYGVTVMAPTLHLEPGVVEAKSGPVPAILDIGCFPDGVDQMARDVAAAFTAAGIVSEARPDIMRWKWAKLLMNLGNAIEVVSGPAARFSDLGRAANREGRAVLDAAGIAYASSDEDRERRGDLLQWTPDGTTGGSTWQSVTRGTPLETDLLTGEIVRLGAAHGVPTPVNALLLRLADEQSALGKGAGTRPPEDVLAQAEAEAG